MVIMMSAAQWPVEHARTRHEDYRISRTMAPHPAYPDCIFQCAAGHCCARSMDSQNKNHPSLIFITCRVFH
jgi:hypothetical protein